MLILIMALVALASAELRGQAVPGEQAIRDRLPSLRTELDLERRLLAEDLESYTRLRVTEQERWRRVNDLKEGLDTDLAVDRPSLSGILTRESSLRAATADASSASEQVTQVRQRLIERLRRITLVESDLARLGPLPDEGPDPITGRWKVTIQPEEKRGIFELTLDGTLVLGRFRLDDGHRGSLRGSYTGSSIRLERVDRQRGFDALFDGTYDPERNHLSGFWVPMNVSGGEPGGGDWSAEKLSDNEEATP